MLLEAESEVGWVVGPDTHFGDHESRVDKHGAGSSEDCWFHDIVPGGRHGHDRDLDGRCRHVLALFRAHLETANDTGSPGNHSDPGQLLEAAEAVAGRRIRRSC